MFSELLNCLVVKISLESRRQSHYLSTQLNCPQQLFCLCQFRFLMTIKNIITLRTFRSVHVKRSDVCQQYHFIQWPNRHIKGTFKQFKYSAFGLEKE